MSAPVQVAETNRTGALYATGRTVSTNALVTMVARLVYMVTRLFVPPFVLARVGLEAYGLWTTSFILVAYLGVSTLGISNVYIKFIAQYSARREFDKASRLLSTGLMLTIPLCLALFAGVLLGWPLIEGAMRIRPELAADAKDTILIVVAIFLSSISLSVFSDALSGAQEIAAAQRIAMYSFLAETILIYVLVGIGRGIRGLAEAYLFRQILTIVMSAAYMRNSMPWLRLSPRLWSPDAARLLVGYGGVVQLHSILTTFLGSLERLIAIPLVGVEAAGLLDLAKKWPASVCGIPSSILSALLPAASHLQAGTNNGHSDIRTLYLQSSRYLHITFAYFGGFIAVLAVPILHVWLGQQLSGMALLMIMFTVSMQIHMLTGPGTSMMNGMGKPMESFYYSVPNILALAISFPLARLVTGHWNVEALGAGVSLATVISAVYFIIRTNNNLGIRWRDYLREVVPVGMVPYLIAAPFGWPISSAVHAVDRWPGAGILGLAGLAYTALCGAYAYRFVLDAGARELLADLIGEKFPSRRTAEALSE